MHDTVCSCTVRVKREEGVVFMWVDLPQDCSVLHWPSSPISLSCNLIWHPASCCSAHRAGNSVGGVRRGVCGPPPPPLPETTCKCCWAAAAGLPLLKSELYFFFFTQLNHLSTLSPTGGMHCSGGSGSGGAVLLMKVNGSVSTPWGFHVNLSLRNLLNPKPPAKAASSLYKCVNASRALLMTVNSALTVGHVLLFQRVQSPICIPLYPITRLDAERQK